MKRELHDVRHDGGECADGGEQELDGGEAELVFVREIGCDCAREFGEGAKFLCVVDDGVTVVAGEVSAAVSFAAADMND